MTTTLLSLSPKLHHDINALLPQEERSLFASTNQAFSQLAQLPDIKKKLIALDMTWIGEQQKSEFGKSVDVVKRTLAYLKSQGEQLTDREWQKMTLRAAEEGDLELVKNLKSLKQVGNVNNDSSLMLSRALQHNQPKIIQELLEKRTLSDGEREYLLEVAGAKEGNPEMVQWVLKSGTLSEESLIRALQATDNPKVAEQLLAKKDLSVDFLKTALAILSDAEMEPTASTWRSLTCRAAEAGDLDLVFDLLRLYVVLNTHIAPMLDAAVEAKQLDVIRDLLETGKVTNDRKERLLMGFNADIVRMVFDSGPVPPESAQKALQAALSFGKLEIIQIILERGELSQENRDWALHYAARQGYHQIVQQLLEAPITEEVRSKAAFAASTSGHFPTLLTLVRSGPISDETRDTLVEKVVKESQEEVLEVLLQDTISDTAREASVKKAAAKGIPSILERLLDSGEISEICRGEALLIAASCGYVGSSEILLTNGSISKSHLDEAEQKAVSSDIINHIHTKRESL